MKREEVTISDGGKIIENLKYEKCLGKWKQKRRSKLWETSRVSYAFPQGGWDTAGQLNAKYLDQDVYGEYFQENAVVSLGTTP